MKASAQSAFLLAVCMATATLTAGCNRQTPSTQDTTSSGSSTSGTSTSGATSSGGTGTSAMSSAGNAVSDSVLTGKVKGALMADSDLKSTDISVETNNGEVSLTGALNNQAQIDRATELARNVGGVKGVQNRLSIKR
jgi:hyperosmotically inducible protein